MISSNFYIYIEVNQLFLPCGTYNYGLLRKVFGNCACALVDTIKVHRLIKLFHGVRMACAGALILPQTAWYLGIQI